MKHAFPIMLASLDLCAAVVYGCYGDRPRVVYWSCAAVLTLTTIWMERR
jgi:hypothetical protein